MEKIVVLENLVGERIGLFDRIGQRSLTITKAIDITALCLDASVKKMTLEYTEDSQGPIVKLNNNGVCVHYPFRALEPRGLAEDIVFVRFCRVHLGIEPEKLVQVIFENAPA